MTLLKRLGQSQWCCLGLLGIIFFARFPMNFLLHRPFLMDFEVYQAVAQRIASGGAAQLYAPTTSDVMMFKYAPWWALVLLPLAWCSTHIGAVLWAATTVAWLLLACWGALWLCRRAGLRSPAWMCFIAVVLLVRPLTAEFLNGQVDILWGLLVIGFLVADVAGRPWVAAGALALAITLKLPAAIFLLYLLLTRRFAMVARTLGVSLIGNALVAVAFSPANPLSLLTQWISVLSSSGSSRAFEIGNQTLLSLLGRFLTADVYQLNVVALPVPVISVLFVLVSACLFGLVCRGPTQTRAPRRWLFDSALLTILMVLCSPTSWIATYSALLWPVMLALACGLTTFTSTPRRWTEWSWWCLLGLLSYGTHRAFWRRLGIQHIHNESYVFLVLMILPWFSLALFGYLWRQRRRMLRGM